MRKETNIIHLHDVLQNMKAEELKQAARVIGISLKSPAKKDEMVKRMEAVLVQEADAVLDGLTVYELRLLCQMLDAGGTIKIPIYAESTFSLYTLNLVSEKVVDKEDDGLELLLTLPSELICAFRPFAPGLLSDKEADGLEEVEQAAAGILAICGTMPFDDLIAMLALMFPTKSEGWLRLNMQRKYLFKGSSPRDASKVRYAATPFLGESVRQLFFLRQADEHPEQYRSISKEEALRMGAMPLPGLATRSAEKLRQIYIDTFGGYGGNWRFHEVWIMAQFHFPTSMIETVLQELCETEEDIDEELVSVIRQFLMYVPRWSMYGCSLADRAKAEGISKDKLTKTLEQKYFHKGLEIVLDINRE